MKNPKFKKGDKVLVQHKGDVTESVVVNVFPFAVGHNGRPILAPVHRMDFSYQIEGFGSARFNEKDLKPLLKPAKKSQADE